MDVPEPAKPTPPPLSPGECTRVGEVLARIGDRWTVLTVNELGDGPRRYNALRRAIPGVSQRMLTLTLRNLERDGLVSRAVTPSVPPRVDYDLTDLGRSMLEPVRALGAWAQAHIPQMDAARAAYDAKDSD
jgi:DNA-binding HxlR family transcriptional regulator